MKKISRQYRWALIIIVLILLAIILATIQHKNRQIPAVQHPTTLSIVPVSIVKKPLQVERSGIVEKSASISVNADFTGLISELYVKEGQMVKAGEPLFTLRATEDLIAETPVSQSAEPSVDAQSSYENAQKDVDRLQKLYQIGGISKRQFETANARLQEAKENLNNPQSSVAATTTTGVAKGSSITVTAPTSGIITGLSATDGSNVQTGQKLLALGSGQEVEVVVRLSQNDLYMIPLGTPATIKTNQQITAGQVIKIYPQIEAGQEPFFLAHIKLAENLGELFQVGMSATVSLGAAGQTTDVAFVPSTAIYYNTQGLPFLYLSLDGKAVLQQITLGETNGDLTELTSKLPERSLIINGNIANIKPGDAVLLSR